MELGQKVNDMDMAMVNEMLDEVRTKLLAVREEGDDGAVSYAVWVQYGSGKTSYAPYEGVTQAELDHLIAHAPTGSVEVREYEG